MWGRFFNLFFPKGSNEVWKRLLKVWYHCRWHVVSRLLISRILYVSTCVYMYMHVYIYIKDSFTHVQRRHFVHWRLIRHNGEVLAKKDYTRILLFIFPYGCNVPLKGFFLYSRLNVFITIKLCIKIIKTR